MILKSEHRRGSNDVPISSPTYSWIASIAACALLCFFSAGASAQVKPSSSSPFALNGAFDPASEPLRVVAIKVTGAKRSNDEWLMDYIGYKFPTVMTKADAQALARKLLTTGVFTTVKIDFAPEKDHKNLATGNYILVVDLDEKWTMIPIIRGVYGGGTPLTVVGVYDIHTFGRLLTLGGEMRKYGDAPPGFVLYARDPRRASGRYYLGLEFWRDFHRREVFDREGTLLGSISTNAAITRMRFLSALSNSPDANLSFPWRAGVNLEVMEEAPTTFDAENGRLPPGDLEFGSSKNQQVRPLPIIQYDDITISSLDFDGLRLAMKWGPLFSDHKIQGVGESELFWYSFLPRGFNLATHFLAGYSSDSSIQNQYFLGGFDSIRGFTDGVVYGSRAAYMNAELRQTTAKWRYVWLQSVAFVDSGGAGRNWDDAFVNSHSSAGVGLRLAVPQVYRLMLRIDYAWGIDRSDARGITAGLNQFFDPYKPL